MLKGVIKSVSFFSLMLTLTICIFSVCYSADINISVDDKIIDFEQPPVIEEGRTLIPLRGVFDALGCNVEWDSATKKVSIKKFNDTISVKIGESNIYKNGVISAVTDVPAKIINGRTMVPVRGIFELFDNYVSWNEDTRTVEIYSCDGDNVSFTLSDLASANKASKILENALFVEKTESIPKEKSKTVYSKKSNGNLVAYVKNNNFEAYTENDKYYEKVNGNMYEIQYVDGISDEKENYLPQNPDVGWTYSEKEKIVFAVNKNGKIYAKTEIENMSDISDFAESANVENKGKYVCRFIADANTLEILSLESYQIIDGIEKNIMSVRINKKSNLDTDFYKNIETAEKCMVTLKIKNVSSGIDVIKNIEVNKGSIFHFFGMEKYNIYSDENCTSLYNMNEKITENGVMEIYISEK